MPYTENSIIGKILDERPDLAPCFREIGMQCLGCPFSRAETIAQACEVHGADLKALLAKLNAAN